MCVDVVFAPTIFHMLCLTNTAIRRSPFVVVLWEWKGTQSWPWWTLTAWCFWLLQTAVIATLQWPLMRVLRLTHNRKRHSTKRLQEKRFWMSLQSSVYEQLILKTWLKQYFNIYQLNSFVYIKANRKYSSYIKGHWTDCAWNFTLMHDPEPSRSLSLPPFKWLHGLRKLVIIFNNFLYSFSINQL